MWIDSRTVRASAGVTWRTLEAQLAPAGMRSPVATDYLGLSVAGTIAVGGYGIDSVVHGMQGDHVLEIGAVAPTGELAVATAGDALFDYSVAGLATPAILTSVTMRTVADPGPIRVFTFRHEHLRPYVDLLVAAVADHGPNVRMSDLTWFPSNHDCTSRIGLSADVEAGSASWQGPPPESARLQPAYRALLDADVSSWYEPYSAARNLFIDYVVPLESASAFAEVIETHVRDARFGGLLTCVFAIPVHRSRHGHDLPFAAASVPGSPSLLFGVYAMALESQADEDWFASYCKDHLLSACLDLEGRPYQHSRHDVTPDECSRIYGESYSESITFASQLDPRRRLRDWSAWAPATCQRPS